MHSQLVVLVFAIGCSLPSDEVSNATSLSQTPVSTAEGPDTAPADDSSSPAQTGMADTNTSDTAPPLTLALPEPTPGALVPTSRFLPSQTWSIVDSPDLVSLPNGTNLLVLPLLNPSRGTPHAILQGPFESGDQSAEDAWDKTSVTGYGAQEAHVVSDADGDGIHDFWYDWKLLPGPMLGQNAHEAFLHASPIATFRDPTQPDQGFGEVELAGFDANADGHTDVLLNSGSGNLRHVYFGPFEGDVAEAAPDDTTYLGTGDSDECREPPVRLDDAYGPGEHAVLMGGQDLARWCSPDWFLMPLEVEPVPGYNGVASSLDMDVGYLQAFDFDGDGRTEVFATDADGRTSGIWPFPFDGHHDISQLQPLIATTSTTPGLLLGTIGDANADGIPDLLGYIEPSLADPSDALPKAYVLLSPHVEPLALDGGIQIERLSRQGFHGPGWVHGDFDGDGHDDLAYGSPPDLGTDAPQRVVFYYSGADLTAADPRTHETTGSPP